MFEGATRTSTTCTRLGRIPIVRRVLIAGEWGLEQALRRFRFGGSGSATSFSEEPPWSELVSTSVKSRGHLGGGKQKTAACA